MMKVKRDNKYKSKCCNEWLVNSDPNYICPKCNKEYIEISTEVKNYVYDNEGNRFPISNTIIIEKV